MSDQLVTTNQQSGLMPALSIEDAVSRYNALVEYTRRVMKQGKDYGVIPGTGNKPTLLKPGAEKLCSLFALSPDFVLIDSIKDFDKGLFYFQYRVDLFRDGRKVGSGIGSCNSKEKKYRYRNITENKATDEDKARAIRTENKSGQYGAYKVYVVENAEPFDLVNTIDKMAQKRALVAATLIAANASEFYTQDLDDISTDFIEGTFTEPEPTEPTEPTKTKTKRKPAAKKETNGKPAGIVQALVDAGLSESAPAAATLLNDYVPDNVKAEGDDAILAWAKLYRAHRDSDKTPAEAAELATGGEQPA